jgi:hypothetical protein
MARGGMESVAIAGVMAAGAVLTPETSPPP